MRPFLAWGMLLLWGAIVGCTPLVPATPPEQLSFTPSAPIYFDGQTIFTPEFEVRYPAGWRVVRLNLGEESTRLAFASPTDDEQAMWVIYVKAGVLEALPATGKQVVVESVTLETGQLVTLVGETPLDTQAEFLPIFEQVKASLR